MSGAEMSDDAKGLIAIGMLVVLLVAWLFYRIEARSVLPLIHRATSGETCIGGLTVSQCVLLLNANQLGLIFNVQASEVVRYAGGPAFFIRGEVWEPQARGYNSYLSHYLLVRGPDRVQALKARPEEVAFVAESEDVAAFRVVKLRRLAWSIVRERAVAVQSDPS